MISTQKIDQGAKPTFLRLLSRRSALQTVAKQLRLDSHSIVLFFSKSSGAHTFFHRGRAYIFTTFPILTYCVRYDTTNTWSRI